MGFARSALSVGVGVLLAVTVSACGDDDTNAVPEETAGAPEGTASTPEGTAALTSAPVHEPDASPADTDGPTASTGASAPTPASGEPIRLGLITRPLFMEVVPPGAQAAIDRINEAGGVGGRPLELVTCSNEDNPTIAAECARKFADDESIIATVGDNSVYGGDSNPALEEAMVAGVGTNPLGSGDYASPRVFANNPGGLQFLAAASFLFGQGVEDIGMATIVSPTAEALPGLVNSSVLGPLGAELSNTVAIPTTAADVSTQAAALADTGGQMLALTEDLALRYIASSRQQGFDGPFVISETVVMASALEEALSPEDLEQIYVISYYDKSSEGYAKFLDDMTTYAPDVAPGDLNAAAWLSVEMFAHVAEDLPDLTRESVFAAMDQLSGFDPGGMTPAPLDYTVEGTALGGNAPRLTPSVLSVFINTYDDGSYVPYADAPEAIAIFPQS